MKYARLFPVLLAAALTALPVTAVRADESETSTIKFSDPAKPGTIRINIANGDLHILGTDAAGISVQTDLKPEAPALRKDGLRVLTSSSSYSLSEKNNVVTLSYGAEAWSGGSGDFKLTVPRSTAVIITNNYGGDIKVAGVTGNIEIKSLNGEVVLNDIAGAALVETVNGEIKATVRELVEGKPLSFTSMNGEVTLSLPVAAKANVRLRTHNGSILTDFDEKALVTRTESIRTSGHSHAPHVVIGTDTSINGVNSPEVREAVREAVQASAEAAHEAAAAIKEAAIAARNAARDAARAERDDDDDGPVAPLAPMAPLPPMTGGKIVTGTLNGGGPEIRIATMNGDVTLRKIEEKK
jgi:hypothetical protein